MRAGRASSRVGRVNGGILKREGAGFILVQSFHTIMILFGGPPCH